MRERKQASRPERPRGDALPKPAPIMTDLAAVKQIDRVEAPSREELEENYVKRRTPVIITGVGTEWRARQWTPEYLAKVGHPAAALPALM